MCKKMTHLISFVLMVGLVLTNVSIAADPSLVAWWAFDEGQGTVAKDGSGNGNDGTVNGGAQWVTGQLGSALQFNGSNAYVSAPHIPLNSRTFTIMMWVNPVLYTAQQVIFGQHQTGSQNLSIHFRLGGPGGTGPNPGAVRMGFYSNDLNTAAGLIQDNTWYHLTFWYDFESQNRKIFINGEQAAQGSAGPYLGASGETNIGRWHGGNPQWFRGIIDDVRIYNRALTQEEIQQAMKGAPPVLASKPIPDDEAIDVPRDVTLSWKPGEFAPPVNGHKVFFSENFTDVNEGIGGITQDANSYTPPQRLDFGKTYYWRVDEVNGPPDFTVYQGDVWQFTVEPVAYPVAGTSITATASSQFNPNTGPEKTINGSGLDDNDLHSIEERGVWLSSPAGPQPTWIKYEFNRVYKLHQMLVWNHNTSIEPVVGFGFKDVTIEYSTNGTDWTVLAGVSQFARAPGAAGYAHNTTVDLSGVVAKYVKLTANSNWGGIIPQYGLSEVRFFHIPVVAREPAPASGSTDMNVDNVTLSWRAGREAAKHNVYLGTDQQAVIGETISPVSVPAGSSYVSYDTRELELDKSYYWKVNEVNEAETPATWQGDVLNFSTQEYLVVDNFEDYNDFEPDRIFDTWIDGWNVPANGSQVGYAMPPFAEQTIIHGGKQSMPLSYDNSSTASYSEATANIANLAISQDWTKHGIKTLSLWFYGDPNNAATEKMYVELNGSKVTYDGDASNLTRRRWQQWNIELISFGVNLRNVTELSIGLERSGAVGGKGKVYFDDIRLYPYSREFITPAEPNNAGLVGHWQFEGNTNDSAGANHGTATGGPTFVAGKLGQAINFDGVDDYVNCGTAASLNITNEITLACWIKVAAFTKSWETILAKGDNSYRMGRGPQTGNSIHFGCDGPTGGNVNGTAIVTDDTWHHVALVYDGSYKIIYIDGMEDARVASTGLINVSTYPLWIGNNSQQTARQLTGLVDDVRIYSRALSLAEVAWLAGQTEPVEKPF